MEYDDYYVIALRILRQYYNAMKKGSPVDPEAVSAKQYEINEAYWKSILRIMAEDELLEGPHMAVENGKTDQLRITGAGIDYLFGPEALRQAMVTERELDAQAMK